MRLNQSRITLLTFTLCCLMSLRGFSQNLSVKETESLINQAHSCLLRGSTDSVTFFIHQAEPNVIRLKNDSLLGRVYYMKGIVHQKFGRSDSATKFLFLAKEAFDRGGNLNHVGKVYNALSSVFYHLRNLDKSLLYKHEAIRIMTEVGDSTNLGITYSNLGNLFNMHGFYDSAIYYYSLSNDILYLVDERMDAIIKNYHGRSSSHIYTDQYDKARSDLDTAIALSSELEDEQTEMEVQHAVADAMYLMGNKQACIDSSKALTSKYVSLFSLHDYYRNYERLAYSYKEIGEGDSAIKYFMWLQSYKDSIQGQSDRDELNKTFAKFEVDLYETKAALANAEKKSQQTKTRFFIFLSILAGVSILLIIGRHKKYIKEKERTTELKIKSAQEKVNHAREILENQSQLILEKNRIISDLHKDFKEVIDTSIEQDSLDGYLEKRILTKDDWQKFKTYFEVVYPGFIKSISDKFSGLTDAELRYLCLKKLGLSNSEIAEMLGVLESTIRKTKSRFKTKFGIDLDEKLEDII